MHKSKRAIRSICLAEEFVIPIKIREIKNAKCLEQAFPEQRILRFLAKQTWTNN